MNDFKYKIGVLGGMGPLATAKFLEMVIDNTNADTDQDNVDMIILNSCHIPDRTSYLLNNKEENPLPYLIENLNILENLGCEYIAIPCNTSHIFIDELEKNCNINIINMIYETLKECNNRNLKKVGIMATSGTINCKIYDKYNKDLELIIPDNNIQVLINNLIYNKVKKNIKVSINEFNKILSWFYNVGCDGIIIGCTELSVIVKDLSLTSDIIIVDATNVLARKVVEYSLKKLKDKSN